MIGKGQRIAGRYLLESEIGAGGMGVVWRARDERLGRDVAVKLLAANAIGNDVARARLVREARAAGRLQHEGIVHVYDVGETDDGGAFLVMELISGHALRTWIDQGRLSINERVELVVSIAAALSAAHELGIVHRDIKPDNVLVRTNSRPVLLDFGLAKPVGTHLLETLGGNDDSVRLTGTGNIVGTPAYLAPEQVKGDAVGPAADQFSLAVMTFELLTGRLPWNGKTVIEVIASMLHDQPLSLRDLVPELPEGIDAVLHRAMMKDPSERFVSVDDFVEALRALFPDVTGARYSAMPPLAARERQPVESHERLGSADTGLEKRVVSGPGSGRSKAFWFAAFGVVLAAIAGVGVAVERASRSGSRTSASASGSAAVLASNAVVACPLFRVSGDLPDPSTGWLGAAAAALACDRVQALLGGAAARTLAPAELVPGLPREPTEDAPNDPFGSPALLERTAASAKARAAAQIEGIVTKSPLDFGVELTLRASDGRELFRGEGHGEELFEAISSALRGGKGVFGDGAASGFQKEWLRVGTTEAALDVLDVTTALLAEAEAATRRACARAAGQRAIQPEMAFLLRAICHERLTRAALPGEPPPIASSSAGALVSTVAAHRTRGGPEETKKRVEMLRKLEEAIKSPEERAIVLATSAELLYDVGDLDGAQSAARLAGQLSPKLVDPRGTPWHRLTFAADFDRAIGRVHSSWLPWEPIAVVNASARDAEPAARLRNAGRAHLLCRRGYYAAAYGEMLAARGRTEEARNIAEQLDDDFLRIRAFMGAAQYKRSLEFAVEALEKLPALDVNAGKAFRFAAAGAESARYLGRPAVFVDDLVRRFLEPEPPHVRVGVMPFFSLVYACLEAPKAVAKRCFARLRTVYERGDMGGISGGVPLVLDGADAWLAGDAHGASKAWRPMLRQGGNLGEAPFRHVLATAFDRADMPDLAVKVDATFVQLVDVSQSADLAYARAAQRARKQGDLAQARKLAEACVERWQHADDDVPARKEMQALLAHLSK